MQHAGDEESREESSQVRSKILQRERTSKTLAYWVPSMHLQLAFNELAGTNLGNHLNFLESVEDFHEKTRLYFYPKIFSQEKAQAVEWKKFPPEYLQFHVDIPWGSLLLPLLLSIVLFSTLAFINNRR